MTKQRKIPLAGSPPRAYRPPRLEQEQRTAAAKRFYRRLMDLSNQAQANEPMSWSITRQELNAYLASLDEIVSLAPGGKPGMVTDSMNRAGLAEPVVALGEGEATVMVRLTEYRRVLSVDIALKAAEGDRLVVKLGGVRIGRLPVPRVLLRSRLNALKGHLLSLRRSAADKAEGSSPRALADAAEVMAAAIDGLPISASGSIGGRDIVITAVEIQPGVLTIQARPLPED